MYLISLPCLPICLRVLLSPCLSISVHICLGESPSLPTAVFCFFPPITLIIFTSLAACCPRPPHPSICNGNPVMYAAILVLQYVNWRALEPHLWRGQDPSKVKLHCCCNYHKGIHPNTQDFTNAAQNVLALTLCK